MKTTTTIEDWLRAKIADETGDKPEQIDLDQPFESFHLDSLASISLAYDIEQEYDVDEINPTVFDQFNTINKLSAWLRQQL